jgi:hypothetical protein
MAAQNVLKGKRPRESSLAGAGETRCTWSKTPEQSQDLGEETAGCLTTNREQLRQGKTLEPRETNGKRGSQKPDKGDTLGE